MSNLPLDDWTEVVIDGVQVNSIGPATGHPDLARLVLAYPPATVQGAATPVPLPRRNDQFEQWLKAQRNQHRERTDGWNLLDRLLDDYRLHADTGTPLDRHVCEGGNVDDCYGCYEQEQQR